MRCTADSGGPIDLSSTIKPPSAPSIVQSTRHSMGRMMPRIMRVTDPSPALWAGALGRATTLGFDTLLLPHPGAPAALIAAATGLGVALIADVQLDRAAVGAGAPFVSLPVPSLDPRRHATSDGFAVAGIATLEDADALVAWWGPRIGEMAGAGLAGVRLLGLGRLPGWCLVRVLTGLRAACPDVLLFGWTPELSGEVLEGLPPHVLDLVACTLPGVDGHWDAVRRDLESLQRIAPVVAEAGEAEALQGLASVMAEGWMATEAAAGAEGLNGVRASQLAGLPWGRLVSASGSATLVVLRTDTPDPRFARRAALVVSAVGAAAPVLGATALMAVGGDLGVFQAADGTPVLPGTLLKAEPGGVAVYTAVARKPTEVVALSRKRAEMAGAGPRLAIEAPSPCVENGRFAARQVVGSEVMVEADVVGDGHDKLAAVMRWRAPGSDTWTEVPMVHRVNDRWTARFPLLHMGVHHYAIEAWRDAYGSFVDELEKKLRAGLAVELEVREGAALVLLAMERCKKPARAALAEIARALEAADADGRRALLLAAETRAAMARADDRPNKVETTDIPVQAERAAAAFASWYEVFPRSLSDDESRHGTFRDVIRHLPRVAAMGFDVLYFPPIHPIGRKNRKGRNNTLTPAADDPGSPYAIGSAEGGHDAVHPELGTLEDFQHLRLAAAAQGIELAIDFAIQCSPDHPWLREHKGWFTWRPDGSIRYAENPPKRYEDIVNVDFYGAEAVPDLWLALAEAVLFWAKQGVRLFRVDNPHTKPLPFWEWMIGEVQARYPDAVFLAEAFTRPKVMYRLAKVGFGQSYTYFTWRNTKQEFQAYLEELSEGPPRDFFRPHFFVNTPDINPVPLQTAPRSGFLTRAALAATLSGLWGVYNGFELCEAEPVPGREEYMNSEKYQLRAWDWDRPGNIVREIGVLNAIRRRNPALHTHLGVTFLKAENDQVLLFEKATADRSNVLLIAINMDLHTPQTSRIEVPFWRWTPNAGVIDATDLLSDRRERWTDWNRVVSLTADQPYAIWRITPAEGQA